MSEEHDTPIKTPQQLITVVVLSFVVPILIIVLLVKYVGAQKRTGAGSEAMTAESVEERIRPVAGFQLAGAGGAKALKSGEQVYQAQCAACHASGAAGAPKLGDAGAWAARIKTGYDALLNSALKGKGAMAAQGGGEHSDLEIGRAVVYIANKSGGSLAEPKAPAAEGKGEAEPAKSGAAPAAAPVASSGGFLPAAVAAEPPKADGKKVYEAVCFACHATGAAGAFKFGDKAAWAPHVKEGVDTLTKNAIKGIRAMPPRGGNPNLSDAEVRAAVEYMVAAAK